MLDQKDILTTLQNGFVMGKKLLLIVFIPCLFFCQISWADKEPVPVFEIKETTKKGIRYIIKIYPDGKVYYHGNDKSVAVFGDRYAELTKTQLDNLTTYFLSFPFEKSQSYQIKRGGYEPTSGIINYKDSYINVEINDLIFVIALEKKLNTFVNIKHWIYFSKNHPEYKKCLPDNFPENIESAY
jgi:hypothetical protein